MQMRYDNYKKLGITSHYKLGFRTRLVVLVPSQVLSRNGFWNSTSSSYRFRSRLQGNMIMKKVHRDIVHGGNIGVQHAHIQTYLQPAHVLQQPTFPDPRPLLLPPSWGDWVVGDAMQYRPLPFVRCHARNHARGESLRMAEVMAK